MTNNVAASTFALDQYRDSHGDDGELKTYHATMRRIRAAAEGTFAACATPLDVVQRVCELGLNS